MKPATDWFALGQKLLCPPKREEPKPLPAPQLCGVCGENSEFCPVCAGAGVTVERDMLAYRRQSQPRLDPPGAFDYPVRCTHCRGTGSHVCAPHQCDLCDQPSMMYDAVAGVHLCLKHGAA